MKFCENCGQQNEDGSEFCKFCGVKMEKVAPKFTPKPAAPTTPVEKPFSPSPRPIESPPSGWDNTPSTLPLNTTAKIQPKTNTTSLRPTTMSNTGNGHKAIPYQGFKYQTLGVLNTADDFEIHFHQRNDIKVEISENVDQQDGFFSLLTIRLPNINKVAGDYQDILKNYTERLKPNQDNAEDHNIPLYALQDPLDFGYVLMAAPGISIPGQSNPNVLPLKTTYSLEDSLKQENSFISHKLQVDWANIQKRLLEDSIIQHELFTKEESFRWDHPITVKAEIENPLVSLLKTIGVFDENNVSFLNDIGISNWASQLPAELRKFANSKIHGGKNQDYLGVMPAVFNNVTLSTIRFILTNSTAQQVFTTDLENVEVKFVFPKQFTELYQPSNLRIISPDNVRSYYDNETGVVVWDPITIKPGDTIVFEMQCTWDVIRKIEAIKLEVRGDFLDVPRMLDKYAYVTPMGFPISATKGSPAWNPGAIDVQNNLYRVDEGIWTDIEIPPSFFETLTLDLSKIELNPNTSISQLETSQELVKKLKEFVESTGIRKLPSQSGQSNGGNSQ